jgi:undecaprenyl phosphate-alpha-L-ara4FN deformylase
MTDTTAERSDRVRPVTEPGFALKVDVDTFLGLRDGAPRLLELFAKHGVRASWFIAMGPDRTGRAALRVFRQKGFLAKMLRSRAPRLYPLPTMLRGTLLPAIDIAARLPDRLREVRAAGHELGIHGFDHVHWHDDLHAMELGAVRHEIGLATRLFEDIVGAPATGFAAPGWQCTEASLRAVDEAGFRYRSDTRGRFPYRPRAGSYESARPEIPTTLPTLDEMIGIRGHTVGELLHAYEPLLTPDRLHVHTVHTEVEGAAWAEHLDRLLASVRDRMPVRTLGEIARSLGPVERLPMARVRAGVLPGRGGTVALQEIPTARACGEADVC